MDLIAYVIAAAALGGGAIVTYRLVAAYRAATGTPWQRLLLVFRNSETVLWARAQVLVGALMALAEGATSFVQDPAISGAVQQIVKPEYLPFYVIAIGLVTELVRRHRTTPDPVTGAIDTPPPEPKAQ